VLDKGFRTMDIASPESRVAGTNEMGRLIKDELNS
jgi:hypothetical protein